MDYNINDIYEYYIKNYKDNIEKSLFRKICEEFNIEIIELILSGKSFDMGNNLSSLSIARIERDPRSPRIDWGESNKYKKELEKGGIDLYSTVNELGQKWHIYYTDSFYCKYYWKKGKCRVPNKSVYKFTPTRGLKGNKEKLINMLKKDDLAYLKFKKY
tara:strand:- start:1232 stop:1708 length:477 start_codon:yes stop_codon:yes gene_type:complete